MDYKPYSREWTRKRYLAEAIEEYFNSNAPTTVIVDDILDILEQKATLHQRKATKLTEVLNVIKDL